MTDIAESRVHVSRALKRPAILAGLAALLVATFILSLVTGAVPVSVGDVLRSLFGFEVDGQTAAVIQTPHAPGRLRVKGV